MTLSLRDVLSHSALAPAAPAVRAGAGLLDRPVRWVHSSEVLEIAHLLRGGELLLTGGVVLGATDPAGCRRYVRALAACGIAGLAIETGAGLPEIPAELLTEADELRLPVIELCRVVPFVAVTEEINGLLVNESVRRLRAADALSHVLSDQLTAGGGPQELVDALGRRLACEVVLLDGAGRSLAETSTVYSESGDPTAEPGAISVPIVVHGMSVARLVVVPVAETDRTFLDAAVDRAPQIFGLALARAGVLTPEDRAARELLRSLRAADASPERITLVARAAGLPETACVVGLAAAGENDPIGIGRIDAIVRQRGKQVLATVEEGMMFGLVVLPDPVPEEGRRALIADLKAGDRTGRIRIGVGPATRGITRFSHSLTEAERCLAFASEFSWPGRVLDAAEIGVELLAYRIGSTAVLDEFIQDHLGPVLALGPHKAGVLIETLAAYFRTGCSKTETARHLNLQRQALYQRLNRAFVLLGGDPTGTPRAVSVHLAARLYTGGLVETAGPVPR